MVRIIIRFSLDGDDDGALRARLGDILKRNGLTVRKGTGLYEGSIQKVNFVVLGANLAAFWEELNNSSKGKLDHFWMYVDKKKSVQAKKKQERIRVAEKSTVRNKE
jgi:hypothetical protein